MTLDNYPTKNDLSLVYSGIISMLSSSKMIKALYKPLIKILRICKKSEFNDTINREKLRYIYQDINAKDKTLGACMILPSNNTNNSYVNIVEEPKGKILSNNSEQKSIKNDFSRINEINTR